MLRGELRDVPTYLSVLAAVAEGEARLSDIHARTKIPVTSLAPILGRLARLHLVERMTPIGEDPARSKRGLWTISDNYLAFWFRFVRPNIVDLEAGRSREVWSDDIAPRLDAFISKPAFERLCRAFIRSRIGVDQRFPTRGDVGAWWGRVTSRIPQGLRTEQREAEVVVMADRSVTLVGEAKWSLGPVDVDVLDQLRATASLIPGASAMTRLVIFARASFSERLRVAAAEGSVTLITATDMLQLLPADAAPERSTRVTREPGT